MTLSLGAEKVLVCLDESQTGRNGRLALSMVVGKETQTQVCSILVVCATIAPGNESLSRCWLLMEWMIVQKF